MEKLLLIILVIFYFVGGYGRPIGKRVDLSEDDDEMTCTGSMDFPGFIASTIDKMMWTKSKKDVDFLFFSRRKEQEPQYVTNVNFTSWNMVGSGFDPTIKTVFIIHGFKDDYAPWTRTMKDAIILREDCNVFVVEWGHFWTTWSQVRQNIPDVGEQVAVFIRNLMQSTGMDLKKVHIIGHSAGAQCAGFAGKEIKKMAKRPVGRITGLDPAGPGFYDAGPDKRLDSTDAAFVDVIHTSYGCTSLEGVGYPGAIGHFDFFVNGGKFQPGCLTKSQLFGKMDFTFAKSSLKYLFGSLSPKEREFLEVFECSHLRAYHFFTASVLNEGCEFRSVQCTSWNRFLSGQCNDNDMVVMGYYADRYKNLVEDGVNKKFYLNTTANPPYCM